MLSEKLLTYLRSYYCIYKSKTYLFESLEIMQNEPIVINNLVKLLNTCDIAVNDLTLKVDENKIETKSNIFTKLKSIWS